MRNNGLKFCKKNDFIYLHIDLSRCISLYFLSASVALALNISSVYQLFHDIENFMSLFGRFQFLVPTCFLGVIYPRYNPDTINLNWNMRNISTHSWCLLWYFSLHCLIHHMKATSCSVQTWDLFKFGFVLITYIPFPFSFSLLYNSSSFYQCLHFVWHLVMYKLLTKILLSPSFCLKCSMPYESEVYFKYTSNILEVHF